MNPTTSGIYLHNKLYAICYAGKRRCVWCEVGNEVLCVRYIEVRQQISNPLTPELNPSTQRCLTRFLLGILLLELCVSLIYKYA
jgi:hypothetical protein